MAKKIYKIEVGNIPEDEIEDYVKNAIRRFKGLIEIPEGEVPELWLPEADIDLASEFDKRNKEK